jgi:hypothetical protein
MGHGLKLIEKIDLIVIKQLTDRAIDRADVAFLSDRVTKEYEGRLIDCSEEEATELFARFATPEIAAFACSESQNAKVRELGRRTLEEMRTSGDPFAADLIETLEARRSNRTDYGANGTQQRESKKQIKGSGRNCDGDGASRASGKDGMMFESG